MAAAGERRMQMLVTRFERLSRRISLAGLLSNHKAVEAIAAGRVQVDGTVASTNFKVFGEASVTLDGNPVPQPGPYPKLWGMFKPRKVLCQEAEKEGEKTLRSMMRKWRNKEVAFTGTTQAVGLDEECLDEKHWNIVAGLPFGADGLVLLTNDGLFARALTAKESKILTIYDVKIMGDPPVDLLHAWRKGAKVGGINYGKVFCSIMRRNGTTTRLRVHLVETPERPLDLLLERAKMNVSRVQRHAFGPYIASQIPVDRCVQLPIHQALRHLCPVADMRQTLVPVPGAIATEEGKRGFVQLRDSALLSQAEPESQGA